MYDIGDNFVYKIAEEETDLEVVGIKNIKTDIYLIVQDVYKDIYIFSYDEDMEEIALVNDEKISSEIIDMWEGADDSILGEEDGITYEADEDGDFLYSEDDDKENDDDEDEEDDEMLHEVEDLDTLEEKEDEF